MKRLFITLVIFFTVSSICLAKKEQVKFGKIDKKYLEMTSYEKDTSASAVILRDIGYTSFTYTGDKGFQFSYERHCRIKILHKNGSKWANVEIPYYNSSNGQEKVLGLKGYTYNIENGKVVKEKLSAKAKFREKINKNWSKLIMTLPNVKEGSVIEFKYTIVSAFIFELRDWQFQYSIPVMYSEYTTLIPEYFGYNKKLKGYVQLCVSEISESRKTFKYTYQQEAARTTSLTAKYNGTQHGEFEVTVNSNKWAAKDIPAFHSEAYMTTANNYLSMMEFELAYTNYPNSPTKNYTQSWHDIDHKLMLNKYFGSQFSGKEFIYGSAFMKDDINRIKEQFQDPKQKMLAAFDFMKQHMKWNDMHGKYVTNTLRKAFKEKKGNTADINLNLLLMLKELGLDASPVLLSTRRNGIVHPVHPSMTRLNYVVVNVELSGKSYVLDATDPLYSVNILPFKCLNGQGRILKNGKSDWYELHNNAPYMTMARQNLKMDEEGVLKGTSVTSNKFYANLSARKNLADAKNEADFIKEIENNNNGLKINKYSFLNVENISKPLVENFEVTINDQVEVLGDMIMFTPMLYDQIDNNPFKLEERTYPVNYGYTQSETIISRIEIPDGFEVEEIPESVQIFLGNNAGAFVYQTSVQDKFIQISSQFIISKIEFVPKDYNDLKEFYNKVVAKHDEQVILKRKEL